MKNTNHFRNKKSSSKRKNVQNNKNKTRKIMRGGFKTKFKVMPSSMSMKKPTLPSIGSPLKLFSLSHKIQSQLSSPNKLKGMGDMPPKPPDVFHAKGILNMVRKGQGQSQVPKSFETAPNAMKFSVASSMLKQMRSQAPPSM